MIVIFSRRLKLRLPGPFARLRLASSTRLAARREGACRRPFHEVDAASGTERVGTAAYQRRVADALEGWLVVAEAACARLVARADMRLQNARRREEEIAKDLRRAVARSPEELRLGGVGPILVVVLAITFMLNLALSWPFVETFGAPFLLTLLFGLSFVGMEAVVTALLGTRIAALTLDEPESTEELSPRARRANLIWIAALAPLVAAFVVVFALARADGSTAFWLLIGALAATLGVYVGAAGWEARYPLSARRLGRRGERATRRTQRTLRDIDVATRSVSSFGRALRGIASRTLARADMAFVKSFRSARGKESDAVPPKVPDAELVGEDEIDRRLLTPLRKVIDTYEPERDDRPGGGPGGNGPTGGRGPADEVAQRRQKPPSRKRRRGVGVVGAVLAAALVLGGCGAPWDQSSDHEGGTVYLLLGRSQSVRAAAPQLARCAREATAFAASEGARLYTRAIGAQYAAPLPAPVDFSLTGAATSNGHEAAAQRERATRRADGAIGQVLDSPEPPASSDVVASLDAAARLLAHEQRPTTVVVCDDAHQVGSGVNVYRRDFAPRAAAAALARRRPRLRSLPARVHFASVGLDRKGALSWRREQEVERFWRVRWMREVGATRVHYDTELHLPGRGA